MSRPLPKAKFGFSTKDKFISFELTVKISTQFKFFYASAELPEQLREQVHGERQYFDSFYELEQQVHNLIADFEVAIIEETKTKVIVYAIEIDSRHHGKQIDFRWRVVQKVETSSKSTRSARYFDERPMGGRAAGTVMDEMPSGAFENDFHEMAWSIEREAWFKAMDARIDQLTHQLKLGFGKTPEILARRIDQGAQLLLTGGEE